uniref:Glutathione peroxidase n=1 Tax=Kryptolebias marmoratus TaxID=37003 RepID=A0A3Q2ZTV5_KRYMA
MENCVGTCCNCIYLHWDTCKVEILYMYTFVFMLFTKENFVLPPQLLAAENWQKATSVCEFNAVDIDGNLVSLDKYSKTNVNYSQLAKMHAEYAERGLRILAFPSNQLGRQEPHNEDQIKQFTQFFDVRFDMFSKINVNGENAHPLWKWLKEQPKGKGSFGNGIKWNFTKFLINRDGQVVKRYGPLSDPIVMEKDLLKYL